MIKDQIFALIDAESARQQNTLQMIPSENTASPAVREAVGSILMNKYAEGQVGARYYQGNEVVDQVEGLCKRRALKLFNLDPKEWGVNVQALSGSPANLAIYNALLNPGDKIMAMYLPDGGHLSHGWQVGEKKVSIVSKFWQAAHYPLDPITKLLDYAAIAKLAKKEKPKLMICGGTAYPQEVDHKQIAKIARSVGAYYLADMSHEAGLIAGGANASPFTHADVVMMTTHKTLRGPRGALIFSRRKFRLAKGETKDLSDLIDFSVFPGVQGGPHLHTIAGIAVALAEADTKEFKSYAKQVVANAKTLADEFTKAGLDVVSGGTAKHLVLVDLRSRNLSGWVVAWALEAAGIIINRNTVPAETASPFYPSGIRLGTPALTSRGMKTKQMKKIASWIIQVIDHVSEAKLPENPKERKAFTTKFVKEVSADPFLADIKREVGEMCGEFPIEKV